VQVEENLRLSQRKIAVKIVIDSYAWIELFTGSADGNKVKEVLAYADELYTPDIVLAEVARKFFRDGFDDNFINKSLEQITATATIIYIDPKLAMDSAICYQELKKNAQKNKLNTPSLFDAILLATSRLLNAKLLTGDAHFQSLPETIWI
jgi:predicted nucleic acid-binding protein